MSVPKYATYDYISANSTNHTALMRAHRYHRREKNGQMMQVIEQLLAKLKQTHTPATPPASTALQARITPKSSPQATRKPHTQKSPLFQPSHTAPSVQFYLPVKE